MTWLQRLCRSGWARRLAAVNLFGLLLVVTGVLLIATTLSEQETWVQWLLGVLGYALAVALVLGRRWARERSPAAVPFETREDR